MADTGIKEKSGDPAYLQAIRLLGIRARSRKEMERFLSKKGYAVAEIASVLDRLTLQGYLNDAAFARQWVSSRLRRRPRGTLALTWELRQKGLSDKEIGEATSRVDEAAAAWAAVKPRLRQWSGLDRDGLRKKMIPFLKRRGFSAEVCRETVSKALNAQEQHLDETP